MDKYSQLINYAPVKKPLFENEGYITLGKELENPVFIDGSLFYFGDMTLNKIGQNKKTFVRLSAQPEFLASYGGKIYVGSNHSQMIFIYDINTLEEAGSIIMGMPFNGMAVDEEGYLYLAVHNKQVSYNLNTMEKIVSGDLALASRFIKPAKSSFFFQGEGYNTKIFGYEKGVITSKQTFNHGYNILLDVYENYCFYENGDICRINGSTLELVKNTGFSPSSVAFCEKDNSVFFSVGNKIYEYSMETFELENTYILKNNVLKIFYENGALTAVTHAPGNYQYITFNPNGSATLEFEIGSNIIDKGLHVPYRVYANLGPGVKADVTDKSVVTCDSGVLSTEGNLIITNDYGQAEILVSYQNKNLRVPVFVLPDLGLAISEGRITKTDDPFVLKVLLDFGTQNVPQVLGYNYDEYFGEIENTPSLEDSAKINLTLKETGETYTFTCYFEENPIIESPHYERGEYYKTYHYKSKSGAKAVKITFSPDTNLSIYSDLRIYDENGEEVRTGYLYSLRGETITVLGSGFTLEFESRNLADKYGFRIDNIYEIHDENLINTEIMLLEDDGSPLFLPFYGDAKAKVSAAFNDLADTNAVLWVAFYDEEGKLISSKTQEGTIDEEGNLDLETGFTVPQFTAKIKASLWEKDTLKPLSFSEERVNYFLVD